MALADALTHRKTRKLAATMKIPLLHALGIIEALFIRTYDSAPRGDIGRLTNSDIALDIHHEGDPDELIAALIAAGFLDEDPVHRLVIHDWHVHCNNSTNYRVARSGLNYANGQEPRMAQFSEKDRQKIVEIRDASRPERDAEDAIRSDCSAETRRNAQKSAVPRATSPHLTSPHQTPPRGGADSQLEEQPKSEQLPESGSDDSTKPSVSSITLTTRIDADEKRRTDERGESQPSSTAKASAKSPEQVGINTEARAREAAQKSAELRVPAQSSAEKRRALKRGTEGEDDADPHDPGMVARGVMDTLKIAGRWTLVALEKVCRLELDSDPLLTSTGLHDSMVRSYKQWQHERPDIFANWKTEDFFGDGHWRNPENWPRRAVAASNGKQSISGEELMKRVREVHGPAPQHEGGKKNGIRSGGRTTAPSAHTH
jgi:hypothetical protein